MQQQSDNLGGNMAEHTLSSEEFTPKKSGFTMHSLFLVLMVMFIFSLVLVLGLNYFFDLSSWNGQSMRYFCPGMPNSGQQLMLCFKG